MFFVNFIARLDTRFELVTGFTGILQLIITVKYSAIANSHPLHSATARTNVSQWGTGKHETVENRSNLQTRIRL
jgi:hypothetical protein